MKSRIAGCADRQPGRRDAGRLEDSALMRQALPNAIEHADQHAAAHDDNAHQNHDRFYRIEASIVHIPHLLAHQYSPQKRRMSSQGGNERKPGPEAIGLEAPTSASSYA